MKKIQLKVFLKKKIMSSFWISKEKRSNLLELVNSSSVNVLDKLRLILKKQEDDFLVIFSKLNDDQKIVFQKKCLIFNKKASFSILNNYK